MGTYNVNTKSKALPKVAIIILNWNGWKNDREF
jgi:hypothetical protein